MKIYNYYDIIIIESKKDTAQQFLLMDTSFSLHENDNWFESSAKNLCLAVILRLGVTVSPSDSKSERLGSIPRAGARHFSSVVVNENSTSVVNVRGTDK